MRTSLLVFAQHVTSLFYRSIEKNASLLKKSFAIEKKSLRYWKKCFTTEKDPSLLKKISSLLKQFWYKKKNLCYIVNIATWKTISIEKQTLRYWKKCFDIEKNASLLKKLSSLLKPLWHKKNLRYIVNIVIKLRAYLHYEVCFCPHSQCQISWERCLFLMAYVSLWISGDMTPQSVQSTKLKFQLVANQFY